MPLVTRQQVLSDDVYERGKANLARRAVLLNQRPAGCVWVARYRLLRASSHLVESQISVERGREGRYNASSQST
jgi:hypothetical protein